MIRLAALRVACAAIVLAAAKVNAAGSDAFDASSDSTFTATVTAFATTGWLHGVPYAEAHALGPKSLPVLSRLLRDPTFSGSWAYTVTTMAFVDAPGTLDTLRSFLRDRFQGDVGVDTFQALLVTPSMMGTLSDPRVVPVLSLWIDPAYWKSTPWWFEVYRGADLGVLLSKSAINGISYSGSKQAGEILGALKKQPYSEQQVSNIDEGIKRHEEIAKVGFAEYARSHNGPRHGP